MVDQAANILRRKAVSGKPTPTVAAMTPEKAMNLAFGRAGRGFLGLGLRMTGFGIERASIGGLIKTAPEAALLMTLGRASGGTGVLIVDPDMTSALIESETMGRVSRGSGEARPATRIDALIVGAFLDAALAQFDEVAGELSIAPAVTGWRVGEMVPGTVALALVVEDVSLRLFRLGFEFGDGARAGLALIALPMEPPKPAPPPGEVAEGFAQDLRHVVLAAHAEVQVVLARLSLPLDVVSAWEPGSLLALPREVLGQVRVEDIDGTVLARGKLGQMNGVRAVRLKPPADEG